MWRLYREVVLDENPEDVLEVSSHELLAVPEVVNISQNYFVSEILPSSWRQLILGYITHSVDNLVQFKTRSSGNSIPVEPLAVSTCATVKDIQKAYLHSENFNTKSKMEKLAHMKNQPYDHLKLNSLN
ncbi:uncharacterized protein LOC142323816 [Lycorma delicatula]|uniref:uncharacterized protein LOC142323816 n=1 Tax=Lycorma delicatula TaxID=130591 RepID=UPI003F51246C